MERSTSANSIGKAPALGFGDARPRSAEEIAEDPIAATALRQGLHAVMRRKMSKKKVPRSQGGTSEQMSKAESEHRMPGAEKPPPPVGGDHGLPQSAQDQHIASLVTPCSGCISGWPSSIPRP